MVSIEVLTDESVEFCIISYDENQQEKRWRCGLSNDANGRERLSEILADYQDKIAEILNIWGDTPTVSESIPDISIDFLRSAKLADIGAICTATIHKGITFGGKQYSLTEYDQMELIAQQSAISNGAEAVPYHADGELCRMFTASEFKAMANKATRHIFYHRTYCNHLNVWIRRAETVEELESIIYGVSLPDDLARNMDLILGDNA